MANVALSYAIDAPPVPSAKSASWRGGMVLKARRRRSRTDHGHRRQAPPPMNTAPVRRVLHADPRVEARRSDAVAVIN